MSIVARFSFLFMAVVCLAQQSLLAFETPYAGIRDMGIAGAGGSNHLDPYIMARNPGHLGIWDAWGQTMSFRKKFRARADVVWGKGFDLLPWMDHREDEDYVNRPHDDFNPYEGEYPTGIGHRDLVDKVAVRISGGFQNVSQGTFHDRAFKKEDSISGSGFSLQVTPWLWWYHRDNWAERRDNMFEELDRGNNIDQLFLGLDEELLWLFKYTRDHSFAYYSLERSEINHLTDWNVEEEGISWAYRFDRAFSLGATLGKTNVNHQLSTTSNIVDETMNFTNVGISYIVRELDSRLILVGLSFRSNDGDWANKTEFSLRYDSTIWPVTTYFTYGLHQWSELDDAFDDISRYSLGVEWAPSIINRWRFAKFNFRFGVSFGDELVNREDLLTDYGTMVKDYVSFGLGYMDDRVEIDVGAVESIASPESSVITAAHDKFQAFGVQIGWKFGYKKDELGAP